MNFASDNTGRVHPKVMAALAAANEGNLPSYGTDAITRAAQDRLRDVLDAPDAAVHFVSTGTAANALSLSLMAPGWGRVFCHESAHIQTSETGAPEFFMGGGKLLLVEGEGGKMTPESFAEALKRAGGDSVHAGQNAGLSLTNATEWGRVYQASEVAALAAAAREIGLPVHMDGARFANAVAGQNASPAEMTWRAGVDILSFGGTKNGCMGAEAVVLFDPEKSMEFEYRRKRGGHLFSKHRYLAAQMLALLDGGLWLEIAGHANTMARELANGLSGIAGVTLDQPVESNGVFANFPVEMIERLAEAGASFHYWPNEPEGEESHASLRFICGWDTRPEEVEAVLSLLRQG
ncbi:threonine aldolase family protein [Paracoccus aminophilus]|uniref:L-threonine aldolase n=1 Tax=Paracoccus aminophilus JCM 7686 TaxID=1367847 RepID=S5XMG5_PARAH|nr:low specificity L-threonine aldolase [Paracoccus aminophilus]AGT08484.1 threonine aldolase [Paracoccus aminophilus JCM 7686]